MTRPLVMPAVSVVIPTNRLDRWVPLSVESILNQQGVRVELVLVLDGIEPPDEPWIRDPRITVVRRTTPSGLAAAIQQGVDAASHELIARLDADDIAMPGRLRLQADYLAAHPHTVLVACRTVRIDENGENRGDVDLPCGDDVRRHLLWNNVIPHPAMMFRAQAVAAIGGYDTTLKTMEDYDLVLRLGLRGPVALLEDRLVGYRVHSGQMSRGAEATGAHIDAVMRGRRALGRVLGVSPVRVAFNNAVWRAAQFARRARVIKPGHLR